MKLASRLLIFLFPTLRIRPRWKGLWIQRERGFLVPSTRIIFSLAGLGYLAHLLFIDSALNLQPRSQWILLRGCCVALCLVTLILTFSKKFSFSKYNRLPMAISGIACSYMQGISMDWFAGTPYIYSAVVPLAIAIPLRMTPFSTFLYFAIASAIQVPAWLNRPGELAYIISAAIVGGVFACILRSRMSVDVDAFILELENLEAQQKLIQKEMELNEQIRAFLPKEIYTRFLRTSKSSQTPLQAMDEVLRCRKTLVACLHSDIRGFTQKTKDSLTFVQQGALPNIRASTDLVEQYSGIPKLIGDLVFAYFDLHPQLSLVNATLCAFELSSLNRQMNSTLTSDYRVKRHVLVSYGEALVGNIGGVEGSRDINVLGTPANILSRIDPLTKEPKLQELLGDGGIITTPEAAKELFRSVPQIQFDSISLEALSLTIRDFPEMKTICCIPETATNRQLLIEASNQLALALQGPAWASPLTRLDAPSKETDAS